MIRAIKVLFLICLLTLPLFSVGAEAGAASSPSVVAGGSNYNQDVTVALTSILDGFEKFEVHFYSELQPIAQKLFALLAIIAISWSGISVAMRSGESLSEPMALLIRTIFLSGLILYCLSADGYSLLVKGTINGLTDQLATIALPPGATIKTGFADYTSAQMNVLSDVINRYTEAGLSSTFSVSGITTLLVTVVLLTAMFVIFSVLAFIAFLSAMMTQSIAFAIGPIFIACLVLEKTSFLFDGWLKFTIAACFTKVVVCMLMSIGLYTLDSVFINGANLMFTLIIAVVLGGLIAFSILRSPEIAQSLVSGGSVSFGRLVSRGSRSIIKSLK